VSAGPGLSGTRDNQPHGPHILDAVTVCIRDADILREGRAGGLYNGPGLSLAIITDKHHPPPFNSLAHPIFRRGREQLRPHGNLRPPALYERNTGPGRAGPGWVGPVPVGPG
jgi:hypothetical protein